MIWGLARALNTKSLSISLFAFYVWDSGLLPERYSVGVTPNICLKHRLKLRAVLKPTASAMWLVESVVSVNRLAACLSRTARMKSLGVMPSICCIFLYNDAQLMPMSLANRSTVYSSLSRCWLIYSKRYAPVLSDNLSKRGTFSVIATPFFFLASRAKMIFLLIFLCSVILWLKEW